MAYILGKKKKLKELASKNNSKAKVQFIDINSPIEIQVRFWSKYEHVSKV